MINKGLLGAVILAAVAFIMVGVAMQFGPTMLEGFEESRTAQVLVDDETESVTTAVGQDNQTITTTYPVWQASTSKVTSITSSDANDTPVVNSISGSTVNITGLAANTTRTITVDYYYDAVEEGGYMALTDVIEAGPTLLVLGFIIFVAVIGFLGIKFAKRG